MTKKEDKVLPISSADIMLQYIATTFAENSFRLSRTHFQCPHPHQTTKQTGSNGVICTICHFHRWKVKEKWWNANGMNETDLIKIELLF